MIEFKTYQWAVVELVEKLFKVDWINNSYQYQFKNKQ